MRRLSTVLLLMLGSLPAFAQKPLAQPLREQSQSLAPFVTSPQPIVDHMLEMVGLKPGELVYDLGCGDGRILITAAQKYKARGIGVEISPKLVATAISSVMRLGLQDLVSIRQVHLLDVNFSDADVVTLYLETSSNEMIRPNLEKYLRPGSRVVSHDFEIRGWKATRVDKMQAFNRNHQIFLYDIPGAIRGGAAPKKVVKDPGPKAAAGK